LLAFNRRPSLGVCKYPILLSWQPIYFKFQFTANSAPPGTSVTSEKCRLISPEDYVDVHLKLELTYFAGKEA